MTKRKRQPPSLQAKQPPQLDPHEVARHVKAIGESPEAYREFLRSLEADPEKQRLLRQWARPVEIPGWPPCPLVSNPAVMSGNLAATEAIDAVAVEGSIASAGDLVASEGADTAVANVIRGRRAGGGRKRFFTEGERERLQAKYQQILRVDPKVKDETAITRLRSLVSEEKRGVDYLRNYQRHIFEPVRGKRRRQKTRLPTK